MSAANTDQQSYHTAQGAGDKNNAQSQSANFDPFGNLGTSSSNAGMLIKRNGFSFDLNLHPENIKIHSIYMNICSMS